MCASLGVAAESVDWNDAPDVTDSGILSWLFERHHRRAPTEAETRTAKLEMVRLLERVLRADRSRFDPTPGACETFERLTARGWRLAMATGCWEVSARLKLTAAGIVAAGIPLICSDDAPQRVTLLRRAIERAGKGSQAPFDRIVSIGDGVWDVRAAIDVGVPFVGIGAGARAARLREAGATIILPDFSDPDTLARALEQAVVP